MNFKYYTLCYSNKIQKNNILQAIKQYNTHVKENNIKHEMFNILHAKMKLIHNMSMRDMRYWTCMLGGEPIGIITCCTIVCIDYITNYFYNHNIICIKYVKRHSTCYKKKDVEVVNIIFNTHDNLNK